MEDVTVLNAGDGFINQTNMTLKNILEEAKSKFDEKFAWLYRNISETNGKPIWEYKSDHVKSFLTEQITQAVNSALEATRLDNKQFVIEDSQDFVSGYVEAVLEQAKKIETFINNQEKYMMSFLFEEFCLRLAKPDETLEEALKKTFTFDVDKENHYIKPDRYFEAGKVFDELVQHEINKQAEGIINDIPDENTIRISPNSPSASWSPYSIIESNTSLKQQLRDKYLGRTSQEDRGV